VKESTKRTMTLVAVILVVVTFQFIVLWASLKLIPSHYPSGSDVNGISGPGEFGEMFGAANALFAGLAFAAVIITLIIQRWDITEVQKLTTEEHRLTAAGLLFDYYTKKISSLRRAEARENSKTPRDEKFIKKLGKQIKAFREKRRKIRNELERLYMIPLPEEEQFSEKEQEKLEEHLKDSGAGDQAQAPLD
jgi:NADH:ubiquinone oxidoreductase subunit 5 (subunit L)/multisubunit Na+/H+ antiporter MnhA subunit